MEKSFDPTEATPEFRQSANKPENEKPKVPGHKKIKKKTKLKLAADETSDSEIEQIDTQGKPINLKRAQTHSLISRKSVPVEKQQEQIKKLEAKMRELKETNQAKKIKVSFFYFDGFKTTKSVIATKGTKIGDFLELARKFICREYPEFASIKGDHIFMLVAEEHIIPNEVNFFELELKNIYEKPGPKMDYAKIEHEYELEELKSPVLKIIDRRFYEQNKHIFPFSKWAHLPL